MRHLNASSSSVEKGKIPSLISRFLLIFRRETGDGDNVWYKFVKFYARWCVSEINNCEHICEQYVIYLRELCSGARNSRN